MSPITQGKRAGICTRGDAADDFAVASLALLQILLIGTLLPGTVHAEQQSTTSLAFVTNQSANSVSVLDTQSHSLIKTISVGKEPAGVSVCPDNTAVYISNPGDGTVSRIALDTLEVTHTIKTGDGPLAIICGSHTVYVADWYTHSVMAFSRQGNDEKYRSVDVGQSPSGLALSTDEQRLYVSNRDSDTLMEIDTRTLRVQRSVATGKKPFGVTTDAASQRAYVANVQSNSISIIDLESFKVLAEVAVGERPYAVGLALNDTRAFVTNQYEESLSVIDTDTMEVVSQIEVGEYPEGISTLPNDRYLYVTNWFSNSVSLIDAQTLTVTDTIDVGDGPRSYGNSISGIR